MGPCPGPCNVERAPHKHQNQIIVGQYFKSSASTFLKNKNYGRGAKAELGPFKPENAELRMCQEKRFSFCLGAPETRQTGSPTPSMGNHATCYSYAQRYRLRRCLQLSGNLKPGGKREENLSSQFPVEAWPSQPSAQTSFSLLFLQAACLSVCMGRAGAGEHKASFVSRLH